MTKRKRKQKTPPPDDPSTIEVAGQCDMPEPTVFHVEDSNRYAIDGRPIGGRVNNRPPSQDMYKPEFALVCREMCRMGATDINLADAFGVAQRTIDKWRVTHKEFRVAMKVGKHVADNLVERSLFQRATGYEVEDTKVFMPAGAATPVAVPVRVRIPADVKAAALWLMNRRPDKWREELKVQTAVSVTVKHYDVPGEKQEPAQLPPPLSPGSQD